MACSGERPLTSMGDHTNLSATTFTRHGQAWPGHDSG
jgi:hypothetical protein